jgi:hypothetical protein
MMKKKVFIFYLMELDYGILLYSMEIGEPKAIEIVIE